MLNLPELPCKWTDFHLQTVLYVVWARQFRSNADVKYMGNLEIRSTAPKTFLLFRHLRALESDASQIQELCLSIIPGFAGKCIDDIEKLKFLLTFINRVLPLSFASNSSSISLSLLHLPLCGFDSRQRWVGWFCLHCRDTLCKIVSRLCEMLSQHQLFPFIITFLAIAAKRLVLLSVRYILEPTVISGWASAAVAF